ncbi:unnamed protein product [Victoria cruziana]
MQADGLQALKARGLLPLRPQIFLSRTRTGEDELHGDSALRLSLWDRQALQRYLHSGFATGIVLPGVATTFTA